MSDTVTTPWWAEPRVDKHATHEGRLVIIERIEWVQGDNGKPVLPLQAERIRVFYPASGENAWLAPGEITYHEAVWTSSKEIRKALRAAGHRDLEQRLRITSSRKTTYVEVKDWYTLEEDERERLHVEIREALKLLWHDGGKRVRWWSTWRISIDRDGAFSTIPATAVTA
jgi:hypothetical protein